MDGPDPVSAKMIQKEVSILYGVVFETVHERLPGEADFERLAGELNETTGRVRGNRGRIAAFTWDDARVYLAAHLRECLKRLESEHLELTLGKDGVMPTATEVATMLGGSVDADQLAELDHIGKAAMLAVRFTRKSQFVWWHPSGRWVTGGERPDRELGYLELRVQGPGLLRPKPPVGDQP